MDRNFLFDSSLFALWTTEVIKQSKVSVDLASLAGKEDNGPVVKKLCEVFAETGITFPSSGNLEDTVKVCGQFIEGRVDLDFLKKVEEQATRDAKACAPYYEAFRPMDTGGGFGMPMAIMVRGYPISITEYIRANVDSESGLVTGISPQLRKQLDDTIVTFLGRPTAAPGPAPAVS